MHFKRITTNDASGYERDGQNIVEVNEIGSLMGVGGLVEICFEDGEWMLAHVDEVVED